MFDEKFMLNATGISITFIASALSAALSCAATYYLSRVMRQRGIVATPTARSSHSTATPVGGGLAIIAGVVAGFLLLFIDDQAVTFSSGALAAMSFSAFLAGVSLLDDVKDLPVSVRLAAQALATAGFLAAGFLEIPPVPGPTAWMIWPAAFLVWIWFTNLYNFMDGIDGIAGTEALTITLGAALVAWMSGHAAEILNPALVIAGAVIGFLVWNWHPARIFLGDVGSIPLGFVLGWMLLALAADGEWAAAAILPAYYLADATITLGRRLQRGEKVWQAHKEHFYQRAHQAGLSHSQVVLRIAFANVCLIGLAAWASQGNAIAAVAGAVIVVGILLRHLASPGGRSS